MKIIAGNWKMNLLAAEADSLLDKIRACPPAKKSEVIVFPQNLLVARVAEKLRGTSVKVGCQTVSEYEKGAYTGENSALLAKESGCSYTLIGHSERRSLYHETDKVCAAKLKRAAESGLHVIYCIGENLAEREKGIQNDVVKSQLGYALEVIKGLTVASTVHIAYEPVWAIGTGKTATVRRQLKFIPLSAVKSVRYRSGKGAQLGPAFGGLGQNTPLTPENMLNKLIMYLAIIYVASSILLVYLAKGGAGESVLDKVDTVKIETQSAPAQPATVAPAAPTEVTADVQQTNQAQPAVPAGSESTTPATDTEKKP
ncbi:hypothetical protein CHS0354_035263 [Potamilus streckersoni]|uniref:Triosephosphate isomerase n=1 Tax=Potamilus streckersoni TaxID=2493646 RepID=A0AAE0S2G3_9BIVA|nr:hypothetical protein CHS0354_035263 [Potamilus streckersoni]